MAKYMLIPSYQSKPGFRVLGACLGVFDRRRQRLQTSAREDIAKGRQDFIMDQAVGRQHLTAVQAERRAVEPGYPSCRFQHDQDTGRSVPGIEVELPKAVEATGRDVR